MIDLGKTLQSPLKAFHQEVEPTEEEKQGNS